MHHNNSRSSSVATSSSSSSSEEEEDYNFELNIALTVLKQQHAKLPPHQPSISPSKKNKKGQKRRRKQFHRSILNSHFGIRELRNLYRQSIAETKKIYKHGLNYSEFLDLICRTAKVYNHKIMVSTHHVSCDKVRIGLLENKVTQRSWMESMEKFVMKIEQGISIWR